MANPVTDVVVSPAEEEVEVVDWVDRELVEVGDGLVIDEVVDVEEETGRRREPFSES